MILDADLTVAPEDLPLFFDPLNKGICRFVNGTRLIYPQEDQAMRFLNLLGNKLFGLVMTFLLKDNISDTLCGTKALYKQDFQYINMGVDKWGDFDLLFGSAKLGNRMLEIPIHYGKRVAGKSKMKALQHGLHLVAVCWRGFCELVLQKDRA